MAIDFIVKDIMHKVTAKFIHAFLPDARKPYNLRAVHQPELNVHGIASKADVYNITTSPRVIEDGFNAAIKLIYYLTADGYKIKTPLFNLRMRLRKNSIWVLKNASKPLFFAIFSVFLSIKLAFILVFAQSATPYYLPQTSATFTKQ
jgi:hypothetical protein